MRSEHACSICGRRGHNSASCHKHTDTPNPTTHACHNQHGHRCRRCGNVAPCCAPECRDLVDGYCVGNCHGITLREVQALGRGERSTLCGPAA